MVTPGNIYIVERYSREDLQNNPKKLYVFGDNLLGEGFGGQAKACRGEPNAVGIPTKATPSMTEDSFFNDRELAHIVYRTFYPRFVVLGLHVERGSDVVWPKDGIGTGLAELPKRAPVIWHELQELQYWLWSKANFIIKSDGEVVDPRVFFGEINAEDGRQPV